MSLYDVYDDERLPLSQRFMNFYNGVKTVLSSKNVENKDFLAKFSYCMVFPLQQKTRSNADMTSDPEYIVHEGFKQTDACKDICHTMVNVGLEIFPYLSIQEDELIVLITAKDEVLAKFADKINYLLPLQPQKAEEALRAGHCDESGNVLIKPVDINADPSLCKLSPYDFIYAPYKNSQRVFFSDYCESKDTITNEFLRLKLILLLLTSPSFVGGCNLSINHLIVSKELLAFFPLHTLSHTDKLVEHVMDFWILPWTVSHDDIKNYFGEKIGFYYQFLGFYSLNLFIPLVFGVVFNIVVWYTGDYSHPVLPFHAILISLWAVVFLEYWKRKEAAISMEWGVTDFVQQEMERPEYVGKLIMSPVDGSKMLYYPREEASNRVCESLSVVVVFISLVIAAVSSIYVLRFQMLSDPSTQANASAIASILNTIIIQLFTYAYNAVAVRLTDAENHKTDTLYENSIITKTFVFTFINAYSSFFFIAFMAPYLVPPASNPQGGNHSYYILLLVLTALYIDLGECGAKTCMTPLATNLMIIFISRLFFSNALDIIIPLILSRDKLVRETKATDGSSLDIAKYTPPERDYILIQYEPILHSVYQYNDTATQFGYITLFATAFPAAPFISVINNVVKMKVMTYNLCRLYQRPQMKATQDIGTWQVVYTVIAIIAVVTNSALVCFTMDVLDFYSYTMRIWIFVLFQWFLLTLQVILIYYVDDVPEDVQIQLQRQKFIVDKVMLKIPDEEEVAEEIEDVYDQSSGATSKQFENRVKMQASNKRRASFGGNIDNNPASESCANDCEGCVLKKLRGQKKTMKYLNKNHYDNVPLLPYPYHNVTDVSETFINHMLIDLRNIDDVNALDDIKLKIKDSNKRNGNGSGNDVSDKTASKQIFSSGSLVDDNVPMVTNPLRTSLNT